MGLIHYMISFETHKTIINGLKFNSYYHILLQHIADIIIRYNFRYLCYNWNPIVLLYNSIDSQSNKLNLLHFSDKDIEKRLIHTKLDHYSNTNDQVCRNTYLYRVETTNNILKNIVLYYYDVVEDIYLNKAYGETQFRYSMNVYQSIVQFTNYVYSIERSTIPNQNTLMTTTKWNTDTFNAKSDLFTYNSKIDLKKLNMNGFYSIFLGNKIYSFLNGFNCLSKERVCHGYLKNELIKTAKENYTSSLLVRTVESLEHSFNYDFNRDFKDKIVLTENFLVILIDKYEPDCTIGLSKQELIQSLTNASRFFYL